MDWWLQNEFGFPPDEWARLVKLRNHGEYQAIWDALSEGQWEQWDEILAALALCDLGRCGYIKEEAIEQQKGHYG